MNQSTITIDVNLDENKIPHQIRWNATQSNSAEAQDAKAMMLSFWDGREKAAMRIDLWTKDMPVDQMKMFMHQIFVSMGNTYQRATGEEDVAAWIEQMAEEFAVKSAIKM